MIDRARIVPGSGLADDADRLAPIEREADPVDRPDPPPIGEEVRAQLLDLEQRAGDGRGLVAAATTLRAI